MISGKSICKKKCCQAVQMNQLKQCNRNVYLCKFSLNSLSDLKDKCFNKITYGIRLVHVVTTSKHVYPHDEINKTNTCEYRK